MTPQQPEFFLWTLFQQLRRRSFALGPDDYDALRQAVRSGFGWRSRQALCDLCCMLWSKSKREEDTLRALFEQLDVPDWQMLPQGVHTGAGAADRTETDTDESPVKPVQDSASTQDAQLTVAARGALPEIKPEGVSFPQHPVVLIPQFPLTYREVAQAWRRLRQPVRTGPPIELDLDATIARRCHQGIATEIVLAPRRRNTARLLLLVDRQGSMLPFHEFVAEVCAAIAQAGNLENVALYYFHDTPAAGADENILTQLDQLYPKLDAVLPEIAPLTEGILYEDGDLFQPRDLQTILHRDAEGAAVVVLSDAGAARSSYDLLRLLDTVAFLKALQTYTNRCVWINPLPERYWRHSTADQIRRYAPMFELNRRGMYQAVDALKKRQGFHISKGF